MKAAALLVACAIAATAPLAQAEQQTLVFLRHGEKPAAGLGQLSCQGLNRALALPAVLRARFGPPDALFAPNPGQRKQDGAERYNYLRPLATLEPTAIALGLPVNTDYGYADLAGLRQALAAPAYAHATIWIAWEHHAIEQLVKTLLRDNGGAAETVPHWAGDDFDSLWVVRIERDGGTTRARFSRQRQGLDGQPLTCPTPAAAAQ
jgi:hypothetical protein